MNTDVIEKARQQFVKASEEFNFTFISPYPLDEKTNSHLRFSDGFWSSRLTRGFTASDTPCFARAHR